MAGQIETELINLVNANKDFKRLSLKLNEFNVFESLGITQNEIRHSDFLSYLLNPNENHGLGSEFLVNLLDFLMIEANNQLGINLDTELAGVKHSEIEIRREWKNIDLLIVIDKLSIYFVIENKVLSSEHSNQLNRYFKLAMTEYPNYRGLFGYLTPDGQTPSNENYLAFSYRDILALIEKSLSTKLISINSDVLLVIRHYIQMLRRFILDDSEISQLAKKIYQENKRAIDTIIKYRRDTQELVSTIAQNIIVDFQDTILAESNKSYIRFFPSEWDMPSQKISEGWIKDKQIVVFEIRNNKSKVTLHVVIGPGNQEIRNLLYGLGKGENKPLYNPYKEIPKKYASIYVKPLLSTEDLENSKDDEIANKLEAKLTEFKINDYKKITNDIAKEMTKNND
jgi:hypothetical protein